MEPDLGSAFDPTRTVARAGTEDSTPGSQCRQLDHKPSPVGEAEAIVRRRAFVSSAAFVGRLPPEAVTAAGLPLRVKRGSPTETAPWATNRQRAESGVEAGLRSMEPGHRRCDVLASLREFGALLTD
jgi:hypothetical protein